ncbi:cardiolipin synthase [Lactococcus termiticola]|uniref:Cardiolipin synthase n=1 Tax=Lactococcus termiticola TaxID=2169526 RepID=A0A2R5HF10_9LACT|nr:cardiolipin synthase [Lactococcus termiticola]GBG96639.1 cardiolipin synthase [Lactococcus termiticola]
MHILAMIEALVFLLNVGLSMVIIFRERKSTSSTWSWLFVINVLPVLGFLLYILIGRGISHIRVFKEKKGSNKGFDMQEADARQAFHSTDFIKKITGNHVIGQLIHMLFVEEKSVVSSNTGVTIYDDGRDKFDALINDINEAEHHVHLEYYIFRMDRLGKGITEALVNARKRGVEVRLLIDAWGSNGTKLKHFKALTDLGGHVAIFFPLILPLINPRTNYRLHRKIVVIDGKIGYTGGFNVGDEYVSITEKFGYWRDTALRLTGDVVYSLQHRFILDWNSQHKNEIDQEEVYFPEETAEPGQVITQFVTSGPDERKEQIKLNYMKMISGAQEEIIIQTPYFIPDEALLSSLYLALLSGVKVKLLIPNKPDHPLVYWATYYFSADLVKHGAEVWTYEKGFVHAKMIIVDGSFASVGSTNFDNRSFQLDFEANINLYDRELSQQLRSDFIKDLDDSKPLLLSDYEERSYAIRFKEGLARLISPML